MLAPTPPSPLQPFSVIVARRGTTCGGFTGSIRRSSDVWQQQHLSPSSRRRSMRLQAADEGEQQREGWLVRLGYKAGAEEKGRSLKERLKSGACVCNSRVGGTTIAACPSDIRDLQTHIDHPFPITFFLVLTIHDTMYTSSGAGRRLCLHRVRAPLLAHLAAGRHPLLPPDHGRVAGRVRARGTGQGNGWVHVPTASGCIEKYRPAHLALRWFLHRTDVQQNLTMSIVQITTGCRLQRGLPHVRAGGAAVAGSCRFGHHPAIE